MSRMGSWILVYLLVVLVLALSVLLVCRPTKRKKVEPEE